jgi:hypothetical protein
VKKNLISLDEWDKEERRIGITASKSGSISSGMMMNIA